MLVALMMDLHPNPPLKSLCLECARGTDGIVLSLEKSM
jgi:hypothetical protein